MLSFNTDYKLIFLDIVDFLIDNGNINHWTQISSPDFFKVLLSLVKSHNEEKLKLKILGLNVSALLGRTRAMFGLGLILPNYLS